MILRKAIAFLRRDFLVESSYKFAFLVQLLITILPVFSFYFVAMLIPRGQTAHLEKYGGDYFSFVLIGIGLSQYLHWGLRTFADSVRRAQVTGVLEAILSTRTRVQTVILLSCLYSFLATTIHIVIVFSVGGFVLGVDYGNTNLVSLLVTLLVTVISFSGIGVAAGAALVILKKGDPVEIIFGYLSALVGGAFFPITLMPGWLQAISKFLPITYALESMRLSILEGYTLLELWKPLTILGGMAVVIFPAGLWMFVVAIEKGRRDGTLMHY